MRGGLLYVIIVLYIYTLLYPQKVNFFDTLQLDNLDNLGNLMNPKWMLSQAACWTSSLTFEGLHPNCDGRMPIFFQNRFGYDSNKAIAIKKKSEHPASTLLKICDTCNIRGIALCKHSICGEVCQADYEFRRFSVVDYLSLSANG